jgi:hypothetical protein
VLALIQSRRFSDVTARFMASARADESESVAAQEERWPAVRGRLRAPLPRLFTKLPYHGDAAGHFEAAVERSAASSSPQDRFALLVVQASGSGKTRLLYELGKRRPVILIRVGELGNVAAVWVEVRAVLVRLGSSVSCEVVVDVFRHAIACHVWWVVLALRAFNPPSAARARDIVLESHRNGFGDSATCKLFTTAWPLVAHHAGAAGAFWRAWFEDLHSELRLFCGGETGAVIGWDEIQDFLPKPNGDDGLLGGLFRERRGEGITSIDAVRRASQALYSRPEPWRTVMVGTWGSVEAVSAAPDVSPSRSSVCAFDFATFINAEDMWSTLSHYFTLDAAAKARLSPLLAPLAGRPDFFFRSAFEELLCLLASPDEAQRAKVLEDVIEDALRAAAAERVEHWRVQLLQLPHSSLFERMYEAAGTTRVVEGLSNADVESIIARGFAVVPPESAAIDFRKEPVMAAAVALAGAEVFADPNSDPIIRCGDRAEALMAHAIVRGCAAFRRGQRCNEQSCPLRTALAPLLPRTFHFPDSLDGESVNVTHTHTLAQEHTRDSPTSPTGFEPFNEPPHAPTLCRPELRIEQGVRVGYSHCAALDLSLRLDSGRRMFGSVKFDAATAKEALHSTSHASFYATASLGRHRRARLVRGLEGTGELESFGTTAVRVLFVRRAPWRLVAIINFYNRRYPERPILICRPSASAIGTEAMKRFDAVFTGAVATAADIADALPLAPLHRGVALPCTALERGIIAHIAGIRVPRRSVAAFVLGAAPYDDEEAPPDTRKCMQALLLMLERLEMGLDLIRLGFGNRSGGFPSPRSHTHGPSSLRHPPSPLPAPLHPQTPSIE